MRIDVPRGGEGGIARGYAARPPLRSGPLQLRCNVKNRLWRFFRTLDGLLTPRKTLMNQ
jgi:hypothetical protein